MNMICDRWQREEDFSNTNSAQDLHRLAERRLIPELRAGKPAPPACTQNPAVAIADPSDVARTARRAIGGAPLRAVSRINWRRLRKILRKRFGVQRAFAVMDHAPETAPQTRFRRYLRRVGWSFVVAREEIFGHLPVGRPVDHWIEFWLRVEFDFGERPNDVVVVTHRASNAPLLGCLLERGARVTVVGLLGFIAPDLLALTEQYPDHCQALDLELDCGVVQLHRRWMSANQHDFPEQLPLAVG